MSIDKLIEIIHAPPLDRWAEENEKVFKTLFSSPDGRYRQDAEKTVALRSPGPKSEESIPFAAYIHPNNPSKGPYGGFSFVIFPVREAPSLIGLVAGTQGLAPDEVILGRPGHARKSEAICAWLNKQFGNHQQIAWSKHDPTRMDIDVPQNVRELWPDCKSIFDKYGRVAYALFRPTSDRELTREALTAFLDLTFEERGCYPRAEHWKDRDTVRSKWFSYLMPNLSISDVADLLRERRYVIIQGPPGTGKTRMAEKLIEESYGGRGRSIQFHPSTTYENFIGGLAPEHSRGEIGLRFVPKPGALMEAAREAKHCAPRPYLLHIDEVNRADLGKVLGEAILLLEPNADTKREIHLPYDFGDPFYRVLSLPANLHIIGTMNSADRSIAIVDIAIRRRFAFVSLWPQMTVVKDQKCQLMQEAFESLLAIFVEHATDESFNLIPGHSYFLERDDDKARRRLLVGLVPLLEEYLSQGYVGGFAEPIRSYLQWLRNR